MFVRIKFQTKPKITTHIASPHPSAYAATSRTRRPLCLLRRHFPTLWGIFRWGRLFKSAPFIGRGAPWCSRCCNAISGRRGRRPLQWLNKYISLNYNLAAKYYSIIVGRGFTPAAIILTEILRFGESRSSKQLPPPPYGCKILLGI